MSFDIWAATCKPGTIAFLRGGDCDAVLSHVFGALPAGCTLVSCSAQTQPSHVDVRISRGLAVDLAEARGPSHPVIISSPVVDAEVTRNREAYREHLAVLTGYAVPGSLIEGLVIWQMTELLNSAARNRSAPLVIHDTVGYFDARRIHGAVALQMGQLVINSTRDVVVPYPSLDAVEAQAAFLTATPLAVLRTLHSSLRGPSLAPIVEHWRFNLTRLHERAGCVGLVADALAILDQLALDGAQPPAIEAVLPVNAERVFEASADFSFSVVPPAANEDLLSQSAIVISHAATVRSSSDPGRYLPKPSWSRIHERLASLTIVSPHSTRAAAALCETVYAEALAPDPVSSSMPGANTAADPLSGAVYVDQSEFALAASASVSYEPQLMPGEGHANYEPIAWARAVEAVRLQVRTEADADTVLTLAQQAATYEQRLRSVVATTEAAALAQSQVIARHVNELAAAKAQLQHGAVEQAAASRGFETERKRFISNAQTEVATLRQDMEAAARAALQAAELKGREREAQYLKDLADVRLQAAQTLEAQFRDQAHTAAIDKTAAIRSAVEHAETAFNARLVAAAHEQKDQYARDLAECVAAHRANFEVAIAAATDAYHALASQSQSERLAWLAHSTHQALTAQQFMTTLLVGAAEAEEAAITAAVQQDQIATLNHQRATKLFQATAPNVVGSRPTAATTEANRNLLVSLFPVKARELSSIILVRPISENVTGRALQSVRAAFETIDPTKFVLKTCVHVEITVQPTGKILDAAIIQSSGSDCTDELVRRELSTTACLHYPEESKAASFRIMIRIE